LHDTCCTALFKSGTGLLACGRRVSYHDCMSSGSLHGVQLQASQQLNVAASSSDEPFISPFAHGCGALDTLVCGLPASWAVWCVVLCYETSHMGCCCKQLQPSPFALTLVMTNDLMPGTRLSVKVACSTCCCCSTCCNICHAMTSEPLPAGPSVACLPHNAVHKQHAAPGTCSC
jgi:hypothetical protein